MKRLHLISLAAASAALCLPALAGSFKGEILAHDRIAHRLVMEDKSIVTYDPAKIQLPDNLKAGDIVEVEFSGAEGDMAVVSSVKVLKQ